MDKEEKFLEKLKATFRLEAEEHLKKISDGLLALEGELPPEQRKQRIELIFREAHSLKGAARAVDQENIQDICQALEDVLAVWKADRLDVTPELFDTLSKTINILSQAFISELSKATIVEIVKQLQGLAVEKKRKPEEETLPPAGELTFTTAEINAAAPVVNEAYSEKTIRISLSKLDRLFQEAEEMLMLKQTALQEVKDLNHLLANWRVQEAEFVRFRSDLQLFRSAPNQLDTAQSDHAKFQRVFTFLEQQQRKIKAARENLTGLVRASEQNVHFVVSIVDTILEDFKKVLMQPISTLFESLPRMVRDIAHKIGKEVRLEVVGGNIEIDRRILEELKDPIIHMIRNSIDHGIEDPEERKKRNKPSYGTIWIKAAESSGSKVELQISDDGKGLDLEKIKDSAIKQKVVSQDDLRGMTDEEAIKLAFFSGVSTSPIISDLSGRGIGLGVVSEKVDKLGGHVSVESAPHQGTKFKIILPLTLATFRGIHITVSDQDFILPTHNVIRVLRLDAGDIKTVENYETITFEGHPLSFIHLSEILGLPKKSNENRKNETLYALVLKGEEKTLAFQVDYIHLENEVLVKPLGTQCTHVKNVMAATIMEWGKVIPILNPIDLIRSAIKGEIGRAYRTEIKESSAAKKVILVVDDSITTRMLLNNILESSGYEVKTAVDGQEAFEMLQTQEVDLLLTDIEMPRMDGFALTEKVRAQPAFKDLPIVICTARGSKEDRERGIECGANGYLDKSSFTQKALLNITQKLL